jgi:DnaK suppressor protein
LQRRGKLLARYHDELARADEELAQRDTEEIERATEQWDARVLVRLGNTDARALGDIVTAIRRIDAGTYGRCERCGERISRARLEALPTTRRCIDCATFVAKRAAVYAR